MSHLKDKVAVITGGSTGIGRGIAEAYLALGAKIMICARGEERLMKTASEIGTSSTVEAMTCDVKDEVRVAALFKRTIEAFGCVDILINNAGGNTRELIIDMPLENWKKVIDDNLTGPFLCGREAMRVMKDQGSGRIINIGSIAAKRPRSNSAAYVSSKFGLWGLTQAMALEGRPHNIAVGMLNNGNCRTDRWKDRPDQAAQEGIMEIADVAAIAVAMADLPDGVGILDTTLIPVIMPYLARG
ncbi:MAG: SDR family NAD(P)-dependent oxidoreductase [Rhodospirillales bacterium]|jgi:NAD(P)-dependent dehydrogenase (short-subunit alcohol dehydrogenase family)